MPARVREASALVTEKREFKAIKGTRDILPPDSALWNWFEQTARDVFEILYGFRDIRTPIFEETELFARSIGVETDVVNKEMFTFSSGHDPDSIEDSASDRTYSLRPEATASVARAYIENGMQTVPGNVKLYYIGPMFRRERPQKGRYRQFYQIGAEVLGQSDAPAIDAEVLEMLVVFFKRVGLTRTTLYVNSIGCKECRPQYVEVLREKLRERERPAWAGQRSAASTRTRCASSIRNCRRSRPIIAKLPRISDYLCAECREHFAKLKEELGLRGVAYEENWRLVRGLDYYTRTTFEVTAEGLGSQNAVCGGGRYDGLVELLGGPPTKGIGFAIGSDRAILSIQEGGQLPHLSGLAVFVAWMGQAAYATAVNIARKLRTAGLAVELPPEEMKFKKSLGLADKLGASYALIIGEDEVASNTFTLKRLADSEQKKLSELELLEYLESERRGSR
jgi:histidyl-tRNA synthetase